ncbi:MAG: SseB family protein [Pseudomonadota bacterium]
MTDDLKPETPLDEALKSALADQKFANFFYDTFLNTVIFMPVRKEETQEGTWTELSLKDRFFPLFLKFENGRAVPVFDSMERLKAWAQTQSFDFLKIKAHVLLKLLDPSMALVLNSGTAFEYILTTDILELLRKSMRPISPT